MYKMTFSRMLIDCISGCYMYGLTSVEEKGKEVSKIKLKIGRGEHFCWRTMGAKETCLFVCLSVSECEWSVSLYLCVNVCLSECMSVSECECLSVSDCMSECMSLSVSVCLRVSLTECMSLTVCVWWPITVSRRASWYMNPPQSPLPLPFIGTLVFPDQGEYTLSHTQTDTLRHTQIQNSRHLDKQPHPPLPSPQYQPPHQHTDTPTHRHTHTHTNTQIETETPTHTYTHRDTHTHTHTHQHTCLFTNLQQTTPRKILHIISIKIFRSPLMGITRQYIYIYILSSTS